MWIAYLLSFLFNIREKTFKLILNRRFIDCIVYPSNTIQIVNILWLDRFSELKMIFVLYNIFCNYLLARFNKN